MMIVLFEFSFKKQTCPAIGLTMLFLYYIFLPAFRMYGFFILSQLILVSRRYSDLPKVYIQFYTFQGLPRDICYLLYSQGGKGAKEHVYLPYQGAISFHVYIVPSGLINIFLDVECDKISCGFQPTHFFLNFL